LLAKPTQATPPPGGHAGQALQPEQGGRPSLLDHDQGRGIPHRLRGYESRGYHLGFTKYSDGTVYHLHEPEEPFYPTGNNLDCDCPGGRPTGPNAATGSAANTHGCGRRSSWLAREADGWADSHGCDEPPRRLGGRPPRALLRVLLVGNSILTGARRERQFNDSGSHRLPP
jgi:hypothetical protein